MPPNGNGPPAMIRSTASAGALVTPGGAFIRGYNSFTQTVSPLTVPQPGETCIAEVKDARWVVPGQMIFVGGAGQEGAAASFLVTAVNGNDLTLLNPLRSAMTTSLDYSTTERATGATWIDGRMVYQKTYSTTTTAGIVTGEQPYVTLALDIADFDLIIEMSATIAGGRAWQTKIPYTDERGWAAVQIGEDPPASGTMWLWIWQDKWGEPNPLDPSPAVFAANLACFVTLLYAKRNI